MNSIVLNFNSKIMLMLIKDLILKLWSKIQKTYGCVPLAGDTALSASRAVSRKHGTIFYF